MLTVFGVNKQHPCIRLDIAKCSTCHAVKKLCARSGASLFQGYIAGLLQSQIDKLQPAIQFTEAHVLTAEMPHGSVMAYLRVVKMVLLSASRLPADFTEATSLHVAQHERVCRVCHQEAVLVHIDPVYFMLKPGLEHYARTCTTAVR